MSVYFFNQKVSVNFDALGVRSQKLTYFMPQLSWNVDAQDFL